MRKAQLTLYMIIAFVIILAAGIAVYTFSPEEQLEIAPASTELKQFVESCLEPAVMRGVEILRLQGGHIYIPENALFFEYYDDGGFSVKEVDGRLMVVKDGSPVRVPFWVLENSIAIPSLEYMEESLADYVEEELLACIDDFNLFKSQGYDISIDAPISIDVGLEGAVVVKVSYPVTLKKGAQLVNEKEYSIKIDSDLALPREFMEDFAVSEFINAILEERTLKIISVYSGTDANDLPPKIATRTNLDGSMQTWHTGFVQARLQSVIADTMPSIKIIGTNYQPLVASQSQPFLDSMIINLNKTLPGLKVDLLYYPEFGMDFDIYPRRGPMVIPDRTCQLNLPAVGNFCYIKYNFKYTVKYPVLMEATSLGSDKLDAVNNLVEYDKGFTFRVPLLVVIYGNQPRVFRPFPDVGIDDNAFNELAASLNTTIPGALFCSSKSSGNITVIAADSETSSRINNGMVYYTCGSACVIGSLSNGQLVSAFPECENGILSIASTNYTKYEAVLSTDSASKTITAFMHPIHELDIVVKKVDTKEFVNAFRFGAPFTPQSLANGESVSVNIQGLSIPFISYPDISSTRITAGNYVITTTLYGRVNITAPGVNGTQNHTLVKTQLGNAVLPFTINPSDIAGKKTMTLFVLADKKAEGMAAMEDTMRNTFTQPGGKIQVYYHNGEMLDYFEVLRRQLASNDYNSFTITPDQYSALLRPQLE